VRTQRQTGADRHTERAVDILRSGLGVLTGARPSTGRPSPAVMAMTPATGWQAGAVASRSAYQAPGQFAHPETRFTDSDRGPGAGSAPGTVVRGRRGLVGALADLPVGPPRRAVPTGARILLAVGDLAQGIMIRRALETDGHEVVSAQSGRDTVLALLASPVDVLLINAPLSDGSADALIRWTRSRRASAHVTCMAIVPPGEARVIAGLYDAGADFVITRNTELDLLSRKVAAALARRPVALAS
jgi:CheY-like chemotaxis protein